MAKIVIELSDEKWQKVLDGTWCGSEEITHGTPLEKVLEDIKAEIKECSFPYTIRESGWDESEDVYMAKEETEVVRLDTIFEIIDKHIGKENINEKDTSNY